MKNIDAIIFYVVSEVISLPLSHYFKAFEVQQSLFKTSVIGKVYR
tara:strand:- start:56 stop:190 length:135 start_codon:yes stop_codon:yes gene_type:complete